MKSFAIVLLHFILYLIASRDFTFNTSSRLTTTTKENKHRVKIVTLLHATQQREFICRTFKIIRQSEGLSFKAVPLAKRAGGTRSVPDYEYLRENNTTENLFSHAFQLKKHILFLFSISLWNICDFMSVYCYS